MTHPPTHRAQLCYGAFGGALDVLRVVVPPPDDDQVLDAPADKQLLYRIVRPLGNSMMASQGEQ